MGSTQTAIRGATALAWFAMIVLVTQCQAQAPQSGPAQRSPTPAPIEGKVTAETVAQGLEHPWALAFLPDGRMLVTERTGRLSVVLEGGKLQEVTGIPEVVARGQGGLLDIALDPDFNKNRLIYLSYAEAGEGGAGTAVARGRLSEDLTRFENDEVIFRQVPKVSGGNHFGSRLVFAPDGKLFVTLGERFNYRNKAQALDNHFGKVVRINPDGSVPDDNPFVGRSGALPEIWSYGHRNPQSAALHPETSALWIVEHGARGGDELNMPEAGKNYGWPVISYGVNYDGSKIGEGTSKAGMEQPLKYWVPSFAPSGMVFYTGDLFPAWKGDLFVGALAAQELVRIDMDGNKPGEDERLLGDLGERIRDVRQGPDGALYVLTDSSEGRILRLTPGS
jgi:glucose/arabinose dehydrogenase